MDCSKKSCGEWTWLKIQAHFCIWVKPFLIVKMPRSFALSEVKIKQEYLNAILTMHFGDIWLNAQRTTGKNRQAFCIILWLREETFSITRQLSNNAAYSL